MKSNRCSISVVPLVTVLSLYGCGEGELEVRGTLDRVVGETVTLSLVEGEEGFSGKLALVGADRTRYYTRKLKVATKSSTELSFVLPPDVAAGQATLQVEKCVETEFDPKNCGSCGNQCKAGQVCSAGSCGKSCGNGTTMCNSLCVMLKADPDHCGSCGNACAWNQFCAAGQCVFSCKGATSCGSRELADSYQVPLQISRLALGLNAKGVLDVLPLPPTALAATSRSVVGTSTSSTLISMAPSGALVATLAGGRLSLMSVGSTISDRVSPLTQPGQCLAALDNGVLVGTATNIQLYTLGTGKSIKSPVSFEIANCQDISVGAGGQKALVLSHCDPQDSKAATKDCLTQIQLGNNLKKGSPAVLDAKASATHVSLGNDGKTAVVADGGTIYGVVLESGIGTKHTLSSLAWTFAAVPVALARPPVQESINGKLVDLYAVAESSKQLIRFVGIDVNHIKWVELGSSRLEISLSSQPTGLAFGRRLDLYVAQGQNLSYIKALRSKPQIESLGAISSLLPVTGLVVQP